jgi:hypothetical protein
MLLCLRPNPAAEFIALFSAVLWEESLELLRRHQLLNLLQILTRPLGHDGQ